MKSVILAGGSGSRLWPLSKEEYPKLLLNITDSESLLQKTYRRLNAVCDAKDIITITNERLLPDIKTQLSKIDKNNIMISEPCGKNTAPAIACVLEYIAQTSNTEDIVLVVPADHLIKDVEAFIKTVAQGKGLAEEGYIVTFGVKPSYPETGYGYVKIQTKQSLEKCYKVEKFVEKPDFETAKKYISDNSYYWNSGIFMGKVSSFMQEFKKYAPNIYDSLRYLDFKKEMKIKPRVYENMPSVSIDYAVMEKSDKIALVELQSDWSDLGSYKSLYDVRQKDKDGNVLTGKVITNNVKNSFIYSEKKVIAASDLEDIVLIETEDAIMLCKMDEVQNVKVLYEKLKESN